MAALPRTVRDVGRRPDDRVRAWGASPGLPAFAVGGSIMTVMGGVVGEALGEPVVHELGHTVGTVVLLGLLAGTGWWFLRDQVPWAARWAVATAVGTTGGLLVFPAWTALAIPLEAIAREDKP